MMRSWKNGTPETARKPWSNRGYMKVEDLRIALQYAKEGDEVVIAVKLPYATAGSRPMVAVKSASSGFDWESGKFIIGSYEPLTPAERDFDKQFKEVQDKWGWAEYENRNLKAEVKKLRKQLSEKNNE